MYKRQGVGSFLGRELKGMFLKSLKTKVAALLVKDGLTAFKDRLNPDTIGGTPFLDVYKRQDTEHRFSVPHHEASGHGKERNRRRRSDS